MAGRIMKNILRRITGILMMAAGPVVVLALMQPADRLVAVRMTVVGLIVALFAILGVAGMICGAILTFGRD